MRLLPVILLFMFLPMHNAHAIMTYYDVVVLGDGYSASNEELAEEQAWPVVMANKLNNVGMFKVTLNNMSQENMTTLNALDYIPYILSQKPDIAVIALGGTDVLQGLDPQVTESNIAQILQVLRFNGIYTLLVSIEPPESHSMTLSQLQRVQRMYPELATRYKAYYFDNLTHGISDITDGIQWGSPYPAPQGMRHIASRVKKPLIDMMMTLRDIDAGRYRRKN